MNANKKGRQSALITKVGKISNKVFNKRILANQMEIIKQMTELRRQMLRIRKKMNKMVEEEVTKKIGGTINMIEGALKETILQKEVLIDKGYMTREELGDKYRELKNKKDG